MMDEEEREHRRAYIEETRERLAAERLADEERAIRRDARTESSYSPEPRLTQSFGDLPLLSSAPMQRWRAEAEAQERAFQLEREARKEREAEHVRHVQAQAAQAAEMTELPGFLRDVVAMVISEERKRERAELAEAIGQLRAEFNVQRAAEKTDVIDLPQGWWRRSDAA